MFENLNRGEIVNKFISLFILMLSFNTFACDDVQLLNKSIKADIFYQYALLAKMEVAKDHVMYSTKETPHRLTINFKEKPYKITMLFDINHSTIGGQKIIDLNYTFENTETGKTYENSKLVKLKNGTAKVGVYDWIHGRRMIFKFNDFSEQEWSEMACPNTPSEEEKEV